MSEVKKDTKKKTTKKTSVSEKTKEVKVKSVAKKATKETTKTDSGVLKKKEQKNYRVLSKIIMILAKIGRICLMICIPFIILAAIVIPMIVGKCEINANVIKYGDAYIIIREDSVNFKVGDNVHTIYCNTENLNNVTSILSNNSKGTIVLFIETSLVLLAISIIISIYILSYLEKMFKNFIEDKTPFTTENTNYVFKIAKLSVLGAIVNICMSFIGVFNGEGRIGLIGLLMLFVIYYVFKYATSLQKASTTKMID